MKKILVVSNNSDIREYVYNNLGDNKEFIIKYVSDIYEMEELGDSFDMFFIGDDVLDDDIEYICNYYFWGNRKKIIGICRNNEDIDKVIKMIGFGINDYILYPFSREELVMRVNINLRADLELKTGDVVLDQNEQLLKFKNNNIKLTCRECTIIYNLMKNVNKVITRECLFDLISDYDSDAEYRIVTEYIYNLRKKLKKIQCDFIETVYGVGYKWRLVS